MNRLAALVVAFCVAAAPALAQTTPRDWSADSVAWQRVNPDGTRYALLEGVRDQPGAAFTYAFAIPAGVWDGAHAHSQAVRVFVAKGVLKLGYGDRPDRSAARAYPVGSVLLVPAGAVHFDGADEDTVIFGAVATGPWTTAYTSAPAP